MFEYEYNSIKFMSPKSDMNNVINILGIVFNNQNAHYILGWMECSYITWK
jgi:hypothetical protein